MVVTDHASITCLRNFKEPEGAVGQWITRLHIMHRSGKHHSHAYHVLLHDHASMIPAWSVFPSYIR